MSFRKNLRIIGGIFLSILLYLLFAGIGQVVTESRTLQAVIWILPGSILCYYLYRKGDWSLPQINIKIPRVILLSAACSYILVNFAGKPLSEVPSFQSFAGALLLCAATGIGEELIFRGYLFQLFSRWNMVAAVVFSSLLFGLLHYPQGLAGIVATSFVGMSFALLRANGSKLGFLMLIHAMVNLPNNLPHTLQSYYVPTVYVALGFTLIVSLWFLLTPSHWVTKRAASAGDTENAIAEPTLNTTEA